MTDKAQKAEEILDSYLTKAPAPPEPSGTGDNNDEGAQLTAVLQQNQQLMDVVTTLQDSIATVQQSVQNREQTWQERFDSQSQAINDLSQFQKAQAAQSQMSQFELNETEAEAVTPEVQSAFQKMLNRALAEQGLVGDSNPLNQVPEITQKLNQIEQVVGNVQQRFQDTEKDQMNAMLRRTGVDRYARDSRFQQFLDEPIGLSGLTRRDDLKAALSTSNEPALVSLLKQFEGNPTTQQSSLEGGGSPPSPTQEKKFKFSREEYNEAFRANFAAANKQMPEAERQAITEKFKEVTEALRNGEVDMQQ